jgi:serine phosphatase RsbU (regulator of sigma subunit)
MPFNRIYSPKEYRAGDINTAVKTDKNGLFYFANAAGVIQFDGKNWRTIKVPDVEFIRTLDIDENGTVFIGTIDQLGKLEADSTGKLEFISLLDLIDKEDRNFGEIWNVRATPQGIFFTTDNYIFRYKDNKIKKWKTEGDYFYLTYYIDNQVYVLDKGAGLKKLENEKLKLVFNDEFIQKSSIAFMLPYSKGQKGEILVGKKDTSFLIYNLQTNTFRNFETELTEEERNSVSDGIIGKDGNYYISTLRHGIICINQDGKKRFQYKQNDGLSNKVYAAELDNQNNLWLALDKGIAKLEIGSPFLQYGENKGITGIVTDAKKHNELFYVSSTNGLFYYNREENRFSAIAGKSHQTWKMQNLPLSFSKDTLFFAVTNVGANQIKKTSWEEYIDTDASANYIVSSLITQNRLYIGVLNQQGIYQLDILKNGEKKFSQVIPNITTSEVKVKDNLLFVLDGKNKIRLFEEKDSLVEKKIDFNLKVIGIENHNKNIFVVTSEAIYIWKNNHFEPYTAMSTLCKKNEKFSLLFNIDDSTLVVRTIHADDITCYLFNTKTNTSKKLPIERLTSNSISINTFFEVGEKNKIGLGTSEGLFYLDLADSNYQKVGFNTFIRKIMEGDSTLFDENYTAKNNNPILSYEQNSLTFFYSSNNSLDEQNTLFRHRLNGYDKKWSEWTTETKKEYTNLDAGVYSFEVEAKNVYGTKSHITKYDFRIKPPYYKTWGAYIAYFILLSLFVWLVIKLNLKRLQNTNIKLEKIVTERTTELVSKNEEVNQQNEEILQQNQKLAEQRELVEKAYQNVSLLSEVGKQITSHLSIELIIEMVYDSVNKLLDASVFSIGIYNEKEKTLDFINSKEKGQALPFHQTLLTVESLSSYCFNKNAEIIISDLEKEFHYFIPNQKATALEGEIPESLIYIPIGYKNEIIGVLSVQSFEKNSYTQNHLNLIRNIAVYAAIALVNAKSYQKIEQQSNAISLQNKNITSSINYASRIQKAMLPPIEEIKNAFDKAFVLWLPRDVVSGDFYWFAKVGDKICIAAVDCTGHGVPGAFMSMVGNDMLNHIVLEKKIITPSLILADLHEQVSMALRQSETQNRDGMDMALCVFDTKTKQLEFAGAKNPLYYIQDGELKAIAGSKSPIGGKWKETEQREYENHILKIDRKTTFFLCTDGYQDQFGGNKGKKLMKTKLKSLFVEIADLEDNKQKEKLESYFFDWKKEENQVDDVLIIGFKVG